MPSSLSVCVIIPCYNRPEMLSDAVASVLAQTQPASQIIIVDNGSDNETQAALASLSQQSPLIQIIPCDKNLGVSAARNIGLDHCQADTVLFLDDDDLLHPRMLETCSQVLIEQPSVDICACYYEMIFTPWDRDAPLPLGLLFQPQRLSQHPLHLIDTSNLAQNLGSDPVGAFLRYYIPVNSLMLRRSAIGSLRFSQDLRQGEDTCFFLQLAQAGRRFYQLPYKLAYVRRHGKNVTLSYRVYCDQIRYFYKYLLLQKDDWQRADLFIIHLKLAFFNLRMRDLSGLRHALHVATYPDLLSREIYLFWKRNILQRYRLWRYYFLD